ncbi:MAG: hypothetical protein KatS3mg111_0405 [Pirellulaceae bacterium]|nr:MAG: hypothetical protein KatS3mg111_0405 [Pirellulaceae bacterium]
MAAVEQYLKPELAAQIKRLDLRAQMIVRGFLQGLHTSPFHGFSVEFSEHRRYAPGDDPKLIDWIAYAKTGRYYIKKFESETNITGYLAIDLSRSMGYTYRQKLTKLDYAICVAAALAYLMIQQQDPVGLVTFDTKLGASLPPRSRRSQLPAILSQLTRMKATGQTDLAGSLTQLAAMLKHRSLVMLFSDLLTEEEPMLQAIRRLRHGGHDIIVFHILDEAEVTFPFQGAVQLRDPETGESQAVSAADAAADYRQTVRAYRKRLNKAFQEAAIDYVALDTSMPYDKALMEYLLRRRDRF